MKTRVTLSIEKSTLAKAKRLSSLSKKSISQLFEEYIETRKRISKTPISDSLRGILKKTAGNKSFDELRKDALREKYGI